MLNDDCPTQHTHPVKSAGPRGIVFEETCPRCRWMIRERVGEHPYRLRKEAPDAD